MNVSEKTRRIVLITALVIIVLCIAWTLFRGLSSERMRICRFLKGYGYDIYEDDLLFAYDDRDTTIRNAIGADKDISEALAASKKGGFPSDVDRRGGVTLVLATDGTDSVLLYMLDGEFELCFVESADGEIRELINVKRND